MLNVPQWVLLLTLAVAPASKPGAAAPSWHPVNRVVPRAMMIPFTPPPWYDDEQLRKKFLADFTRELTQAQFGARWPDAVQDRSDCVAYSGDSDPLPNEYWVYSCRTRTEFGVRSDYAYLLGENERPTRERIRYSISGPPADRAKDWQGIRDSLVASLSRSLSPHWSDHLGRQIGVAGDRVFEAELFVTYPDTAQSKRFTILSFPSAGGRPVTPQRAPPSHPRTTVDSLVVECFSSDLDAETHESNWGLLKDSPPDSSAHLGQARDDVIRALRERRYDLAAALESTRVTIDQIKVVDAAVSRARSLHSTVERDLVLYGAHLWAQRVLERLPKTQDGCDYRDTTYVHAFNTAFATRDRSWIECGHYGDWWYSGGFLDSVVTRAGKDPWADDAFLECSILGWNESHGCSDDPAIGVDEFRPVIARGEAFLTAHPKSAIARELRLLVAEAHETAWSLSKGGNIMSADWMTYATDAPAHRARAMELYEAHLRDWPLHPQNKAIRRRLNRLRIDVDTGYQPFWCFND